MRILLVEDDLMIGGAVQSALKDAAYATDWVKDGAAAMSALAVQHYDAVLLDLGLPGKGGLEILRAIRNKGDSTPVLIITARDEFD